jgi:hypothetical protein
MTVFKVLYRLFVFINTMHAHFRWHKNYERKRHHTIHFKYLQNHNIKLRSKAINSGTSIIVQYESKNGSQYKLETVIDRNGNIVSHKL